MHVPDLSSLTLTPPLALPRVESTGAKRGREEPGTEAEKLLNILHALPSLDNVSAARLGDLQPDYLDALSEAQFDMLLSLRLYTGSFYRLMAPVLDPSHVRDVQSSAAETLAVLSSFRKAEDDPSALLYFALVNSRRRMASKAPSPLFLNEKKENVHVDMQERDFRRVVAFFTTRYGGHFDDGRSFPKAMLDKFTGRVSDTTAYADQLRSTEMWKAQPLSHIVDASLRELWAAVRHAALALRTLILESNVVTGNDAVPVYRGLKTDSWKWNVDQMNNSFVSVSREEEIARAFTTNPELSYTDPEIGAPNQCCIMRVSLLEKTPYLDVDKALQHTNGWGKFLGERELILPPGLDWQLGNEERDKQPAHFPEAISEKSEGSKGESYYVVDYYTAGLAEHD